LFCFEMILGVSGMGFGGLPGLDGITQGIKGCVGSFTGSSVWFRVEGGSRED
jgi:hypothetical protein